MFRIKKILFAAILCALVAVDIQAQMSEDASIEEKLKITPWMSTDFSIANSVGIGTFVSGYAHTPQWTTSFALEPHTTFRLVEDWPQMTARAGMNADVWWLNSTQTSALDSNQRIQFSDLQFGVSASKVFEIPKIGVSFGADLPINIAISKSSLALNRVLSLGLGTSVKWKKGEFSVSYSPSARGWIHKGEAKEIDCFERDTSSAAPRPLGPRDPDFAVDQYLLSLAVFRDEESSDGLKCKVVGRQSLWTVKNSLGFGWTNQTHSVSLGLTYYWNMLRPLEDRPELAGLYSSTLSFTQAVLGKVAYSYALPIVIDTTLTAGITSYQGIFSKTGSLLFPFFDFATPNKNQTQIFVEMVTSI